MWTILQDQFSVDISPRRTPASTDLFNLFYFILFYFILLALPYKETKRRTRKGS